MNTTYGIEAPPGDKGAQPGGDTEGPARAPVRFVVLIDSAADANRVARLFLEDRSQVAEFDASSPEVQQLTAGLLAERGAGDTAWDSTLAGHSPAERAGAEVYTLAV